MTKKMVLALLFAALIGGSVFAQSNAPNTITFGSMLAYERTLTPKFAIGVDAALDFIGLPTVTLDGTDVTGDYAAILPLSIDAFARLYPWEGKFFAHLGLGFQTFGLGGGDDMVGADTKGNGFHAKLQAGWKIDIGQPAKWIFEARVGPAMSVGGVSYKGEVVEKMSFFLLSFPIQVGFGYSF